MGADDLLDAALGELQQAIGDLGGAAIESAVIVSRQSIGEPGMETVLSSPDASRRSSTGRPRDQWA